MMSESDNSNNTSCSMKGKIDPSLDYSVIKEYFAQNNAEFNLPESEFKGLTEEEKKVINACGTYCGGCDDYGVVCDGCRNRDGRPIWYDMFGKPETCIYAVCTNEKGCHNCSECDQVPCKEYFQYPDPNMPDDIKQMWFKMRMENFNKLHPELKLEIKETWEENVKRYN